EERVRNSTGLAVRPSWKPSQIQRANGSSPAANRMGLNRPIAAADHCAGRGAVWVPAMLVGPRHAGSPRQQALVIGPQVHALVERRHLLGVAVEHQRLALGREQAVLADAPLG